MDDTPARAWNHLAAVVGLVLVAAHLAIRATSGFGWVAVFQFLTVAPWLVLPFVPVALHVTRRTVFTDRPTRVLVVLGTVAFLVSAFTLDVADSWGECFLGACREPNGPDLWWESLPLVDASPWVSMALSWCALLLLVASMILTRTLRRRPPPPGPTDATRPAPPVAAMTAVGQTQSTPGMPTGTAMTEPGPMASDADR